MPDHAFCQELAGEADNRERGQEDGQDDQERNLADVEPAERRARYTVRRSASTSA